MKALSLWQPWASALVCGTKRFETRGYACPSTVFGKSLAIHAAKRPPRLAEIGEDFEDYCPTMTGHEWRDLPLGAVVGIVRVQRCYRAEQLVGPDGEPKDFGRTGEGMGDLDLMLGNYAPGRYAWRVEVLERFETPIPASGMQGIWEWERKSLEDLRRDVAGRSGWERA